MSGAVADSRDMIDDLVIGRIREAHELQFEHWLETSHRHT
jgi:hypothetical protein